MRWFPLSALALFFIPILCAAQSSPKEDRIFSQPASVIRTAVKKLPGGTSGPLPVLDGFVVPAMPAQRLVGRSRKRNLPAVGEIENSDLLMEDSGLVYVLWKRKPQIESVVGDQPSENASPQ